jgi:hypothetical protein
MGCDIHTVVEVYDTQRGWVLAPGQYGPCHECDGTRQDKYSVSCEHCTHRPDEHVPETNKCLFDTGYFKPKYAPCIFCDERGEALHFNEYYQGRNYELFGTIAGVRSGPLEGHTIEDRGTPEDASPEYKKEAVGPDFHSHGYYTLEELQAFPKKAWKHTSFRETLLRMAALSANPAHVRILFCFDN